MSEVWGKYPGGGSDLLALLAMADYSDDSGYCFPSIAAIARKTRLSRSQTQRVVHKLIDEGVVTVTANMTGGAPGVTRRYKIIVSRLTGRTDAAPTGSTHATGSAGATGSTHAQDGSHPCAETGRTHATQTVIEPSLTVKGKAAAPDCPPLAQQKKKTRSSGEITFNAWREQIKATGEKAISDYQPVWDYAEKTGLPGEWISLAWITFKERYATHAGYQDKKYTDWRQVFLNAVKGNWFKLWFVKDNQFSLSTQGHQAELATREAV